MPIKPLKEKVSVSLDADVLGRLRDLAEYEGLQLSTYINVVLRKYVRNLDEK